MTDKAYPEPDELFDADLIKEVMEIAEANYYPKERGYRALKELTYRLQTKGASFDAIVRAVVKHCLPGAGPANYAGAARAAQAISVQ